MVLQVNAELKPDPAQDAASGEDTQLVADRKMAATFRGFAEM